MELNKQNILDKTHYGLNIYAYVLRQYYPNQTVLSLKGRDCGITRNPFNDDRKTLKINVIKNVAKHIDLENPKLNSDVFGFAQLHFKFTDENTLLLKINEALHLNLNREHILKAENQFNPHFKHHYYCSFYKAPVRNVYPFKKLNLSEVFQLIVSYKYKSITEKYRTIQDPKEARKFKANSFDYVTFSGVFSKRSDDNLVKHSKLLTIDFDHLKNVDELKNNLLFDEYFETELLFTSPSGEGLKWIIKVDLSEVSHSNYFRAVSNYVKQKYNVEVDQSGKDVSRACFLAHDPMAYLHIRHRKC